MKNGVSRRKKRNPHPVHILSYSETSPKERGCSDEGRMMNDGGNRGNVAIKRERQDEGMIFG